MVLFADVVYHGKSGLVDVSPGIYWERVYAVLSPLHRNVPGATSCPKVGVAGFNLGGGFGAQTNQYGLAIDAIRSIEVVVPTGQILTVCESGENSDLFWALKGGGNNFGIVTKWSMATHEQGGINSWVLQFKAEYFNDFIKAILDYQEKQVVISNVEAFFEFTHDGSATVAIASTELFYDSPNEQAALQLFNAFFAIPHTVVNHTQTWMDRHRALPRDHQTFRVGLPRKQDDLPPFRGRFSCAMTSRYTEALIRKGLKEAEKYAHFLRTHDGLQIYIDIWPFNPKMYDHSKDAAWPHRAGAPNGPLVINFKWRNPADDDFWMGKVRATTNALRDEAIKQGVATPKTPVYYNLALDGTPARSIYQENTDRLISIRDKYDPRKTMNRTGGFRV